MMARPTAAMIAVIAMATALTTPADAKRTPVRSSAVWSDIVQLERDVNSADNRDTISEREAAGIRGEIAELKGDYNRMNRNGLSPAQANKLEDRIRRLRARLHNEKKDANHHRG